MYMVKEYLYYNNQFELIISLFFELILSYWKWYYILKIIVCICYLCLDKNKIVLFFEKFGID